MNKKNNILIAEFLGGEVELWKTEDRLGEDIENDAYYVYFPDFIGGIAIEDLDYHENWNSLMEVVEKIENHSEFCSVLFTPNGCAIDVNIKNGFHYCIDCDTKIEAVYNACVQFIKWFNNRINKNRNTLKQKMKLITVKEYGDLIGYTGKKLSLIEIQNYAENNLDITLWDYPLNELDYVLNEHTLEEIAFVNTKIGIRICELL